MNRVHTGPPRNRHSTRVFSLTALRKCLPLLCITCLNCHVFFASPLKRIPGCLNYNNCVENNTELLAVPFVEHELDAQRLGESMEGLRARLDAYVAGDCDTLRFPDESPRVQHWSDAMHKVNTSCAALFPPNAFALVCPSLPLADESCPHRAFRPFVDGCPVSTPTSNPTYARTHTEVVTTRNRLRGWESIACSPINRTFGSTQTQQWRLGDAAEYSLIKTQMAWSEIRRIARQANEIRNVTDRAVQSIDLILSELDESDQARRVGMCLRGTKRRLTENRDDINTIISYAERLCAQCSAVCLEHSDEGSKHLIVPFDNVEPRPVNSCPFSLLVETPSPVHQPASVKWQSAQITDADKTR